VSLEEREERDETGRENLRGRGRREERRGEERRGQREEKRRGEEKLSLRYENLVLIYIILLNLALQVFKKIFYCKIKGNREKTRMTSQFLQSENKTKNIATEK
jgi:hypothetical protein